MFINNEHVTEHLMDEEYKAGFLGNEFSDEKTKEDGTSISLTESQEQSRNSFLTCFTKISRQEEDAYKELFQLFLQPDICFPSDLCEQMNIFQYISDFLLTVTDASQLIPIINVIDSINRQTQTLCEQFVQSNIFDILLNQLGNEILFPCLLTLFAYTISQSENAIMKITKPEYFPIFEFFNDTMLLSDWKQLSTDINQSILSFYISTIPFLNDEANSLFSKIVTIIMNFFDIDTPTNLLFYACSAVMKTLIRLPETLTQFIEEKIFQKIIALINKHGQDPSNDSMDITGRLLSILTYISSIDFEEDSENSLLQIIIQNISEIDSFLQTFLNCCTHFNEEAAKNAFQIINNFLSSEIIHVEDLCDKNFSAILVHAITDGNIQIKRNAITCIMNIAIYALPEQLPSIISPDTLKVLADEIVSYYEIDQKTIVNCIGLVLSKLSSCGFFEEATECFKNQQFYDYLFEIYDHTDDEELKQQSLDIAENLGFTQNENE